MHFWKSYCKDEREILPPADNPVLPERAFATRGQAVGRSAFETSLTAEEKFVLTLKIADPAL